MKSFHLPLPEEVYIDLTSEAERMKQPATSIAREAIESWLKQRRKLTRHQMIAEFAAELIGARR